MGQAKKKLKLVEPLKLDFGCGPRKREGFKGADSINFPGVDFIMDIRKTPWPWADESVDEAHASHFVEHLDGSERVKFFNELYRVMKKGAQVMIVVPDWSNDCAYGDPTHKFPPMSRWSFLYLNKGWRDQNAPHSGYDCNFEGPIGGNLEQWVTLKSEEAKIFNSQHYINALRELVCTLTKI